MPSIDSETSTRKAPEVTSGEVSLLLFQLEGVPPSENQIRTLTRPHVVGGRVVRPSCITYTSEALTYKQRTSKGLVACAAHPTVSLTGIPLVTLFLAEDKPWHLYRVDLTLQLPGFLNKGWPKGAAKTPYKEVDVQNRQKVVLDALVDALGGSIDDSRFASVGLRKEVALDTTGRTFLGVYRIDPRSVGVPDAWIR